MTIDPSRHDIDGGQSDHLRHIAATAAPPELDILELQRTCVHDGPGVRTTVFFRGCNLRCAWCQNPEALTRGGDEAKERRYTRSEVIDVLLRDIVYFQKTGGGITLSGGDPLLQDPEALLPLLEMCKAHGIHVAAETSLFVPWEHVSQVAPHIDTFFVDLKVVGDDVQHKRCTGRSSRLIHRNIDKLLAVHADVRFRMVVVPGYNDAEAHVRAVARFLESHGHPSIELLKYHSMHEDKAERLGVPHQKLSISNDEAVASLGRAMEWLEAEGIAVECTELGPPRKRATFTKRVCDIREAIRSSKYNICFETSFLKTDFYRQHGFDDPAPLHRSKRLAHVLDNKKLTVYPQELLVGNFTTERHGAQLWEEHNSAVFALVLHRIDEQRPISFECSRADRWKYYRTVVPFWLGRGIFSKANASLDKLTTTLARYAEMSTGFINNFASIAHYVVNYQDILEHGTTGLVRIIQEERSRHPEHDQATYDGAIIALEAMEAFAARYADHLEELCLVESDPVRRGELADMATICRRVPEHPARTYHEALQSMLFLHISLCIESFENAISPGRLDQILYPYYLADKRAGIIDYERAKELLALFILKLDEVVFANDGDSFFRIGRLFETISTDQTVTAGGLGSDGEDATNELTYALLDICELQPYSVNMTARVHPDSPREYLERIAEVYLTGAPMPALYNDEIYVETLQKHYDTTVEEARNYAIIGCVEPNASSDHFGNTDCANINVALPFLQALRGNEDELWRLPVPRRVEKIAAQVVNHFFQGEGIISRAVSSGYGHLAKLFERLTATEPTPPATMEELLERFQRRLNHLAKDILSDHQEIEAIIREDFPTPLASSLSKGCREKGVDINAGGARHNSSGIQAVGITDVADSLHAIDEVVFKARRYSLMEIIRAMDEDFVGDDNQRIRQTLLEVPKFGQDGSEEATAWVNRTMRIYVEALRQVPRCPRDGIYTAGYYALNVNDMYGKSTPALPSGRLAGVSLANSVTPHYGMKATDLMSSLNAVAGVDFVDHAPNGTTVTFTIDSALFQGPEGPSNLAGIFSSFFDKGGMQFQPNVVSREMLLDAYEHPEKYPYLLVRVAGYCAYFNELSDDLKKIIVNRTCYH